jgi:predicted 2-oxoglutarate/Fe(II)-dependent dioxygenase YbiX
MITTFVDGILHIRGLLDREMCEAIAESAEVNGYEVQIYEPPLIPEVRQRAMFNDAKTAQALTERIVPTLPPLASFFEKSNIPAQTIKQLWSEWHPKGINERFRFYKYTALERFAPHVDHEFARNEYERTFLSVVIYLNDGFEGGETRFAAHSFTPVQGDALIYAHEKMHEGGIVKSGCKIILRTDILYLHKLAKS